MKYYQFTLSMPGKASWNGKWSGEGNLYAKVRKFPNNSKFIPKEDYYSYCWSDGWRAAVEVKQIDSDTARKVTKKSQGFCNYEWMIDSIIAKGFISAD